MMGLVPGTSKVAMMRDCRETREFCLVPCNVTFVSLNKVKFYRDFNLGSYADILPFLEKEAQQTISIIKNSLLFSRGIINTVTYDINKLEQIVYFDILLAQVPTSDSFIEVLGYLNSVLTDKVTQ